MTATIHVLGSPVVARSPVSLASALNVSVSVTLLPGNPAIVALIVLGLLLLALPLRRGVRLMPGDAPRYG